MILKKIHIILVLKNQKYLGSNLQGIIQAENKKKHS